MLHTHIDISNNIIVVSPDGKIDKSDFESLAEQIDQHINETDTVPSLLIESEHLPHWDSFGAFIKHMKLIKSHQNIIPKVAIVSDSKALSVIPSMADHFLKAKIRHFSTDRCKSARKWLTQDDEDIGSFEIKKSPAANVIYVEAKGTITAQDYEQNLIPVIEEKLKTHDHLNILFVAGDEFKTFTPGAIWDDAKFGLMHLTDFQRIAIVTDVDWLEAGAKFFGPLIPGRLHVFDLDELDEAKDWVVH